MVADQVPAPATLVDVARRAGVHPSTASRALGEHTRERVSPATVTAVRDAARRLGYQPNALARGLKLSRTFTVGMLVPDITNPLFPPIVRGIEDRLLRAGLTLVLANTDNDDAKERSLLAAMSSRRVDGLLLATARRSYPLLAEISAAGLPAVLVNRTTDEPTVPAVLGDDQHGIGQAVKHLAGLGHTRIGFVGAATQVSTGMARQHAFESWMRHVGLVAEPQRIVLARWFKQDLGADAFAELLDRDPGVTAVVCGNDLIAIGGYGVLRQRGLRCPEDVSVVGYNDNPYNDKFWPPLTSVRSPSYEIGQRAAAMLVEAIESAEPPGGGTPAEVRLRPELVVRGSTAPPCS